MQIRRTDEGARVLVIYPRVWSEKAASMSRRYRHLLNACDSFEPSADVQSACVRAAFEGAPMPDLGEWAERADRILIGAGPPEAVKFALAIVGSFSDKAIISWHDPLPEEHAELEAQAAKAARCHIVPTRPHRDRLLAHGAQSVVAATPLLDDHEIPLTDRRDSFLIGHLGWVGRHARNLPGLVKGTAAAHTTSRPWQVVQYGPLPKGMPLQLLPYRIRGAFRHKRAVSTDRVDRIYSRMRAAAILQMGGFYGDLCIPGKLIEAILLGCPPLCDRRAAFLAKVCDEAALPSWGDPKEIPDRLHDLDRATGSTIAQSTGHAIADCSLSAAVAAEMR
ncbi:MAG: hypothetical protein IH851_06480 [Armatimonadetes bacterium]|nr:hypothetical protein [Armatimonadota bacterium]